MGIASICIRHEILKIQHGIAKIALLATASALPAVCVAQPTTVTLNIQLDKPAHAVSPTLYGLMTEEINYSYDGGLYAELVRNRAFHPGWDEPAHWFLMQYGDAQASMALDPSTGPSANRRLSLRLNV